MRHRRDLGRSDTDPGGQGRAIERHALPGQPLALAVERKVVGEACYQYMRDQGLGRDPALDQPRWRGLLQDHAGTGATSQLRSPRHDHAELRRDHVEPLGGVLADLHHGRPTARARRIGRSQFHFNPR
jgi:hypothetical protein